MWTRHHRKSPLRHLVLPLIAGVVMTYFTHHAMNGKLGLKSQQAYAGEIVLLQEELKRLETRRFALEKKTAMLRDGSLERDMIDEQARRLLGVTRSREIVILHANAN
jgi:cell division protein FtsB